MVLPYDDPLTDYPYKYPYDTKLELLSNKIIELEEQHHANCAPIILRLKLEYILYTIDSLNKDSKNKKELSPHLISLETTEYRLNRLEKEIKTKIKDEETFALLAGRRLCELEKQLSIKDETHTKEKIKTEERLNKLEEDINKKIEQIQQKNVMLCELNVNLVKKVDAQIKEQLKTEERLAKLEEDNRELRKIIDELRPTKSSYM